MLVFSNKEEQQFSIQPHPAKDNDPSSLDSTPGLMGDKSNPTSGQPGPHIMSNETAKRCAELEHSRRSLF